MKYLDIKEFTEFGYLHEINRQFLHPLGLALVVDIDDDDNHSLKGIWDNRDDPEGIAFSEDTLDVEKAVRVGSEKDKRAEARKKLLGDVIQPVNGYVI